MLSESMLSESGSSGQGTALREGDDCALVIRELTNYMEGLTDPLLRAQIEFHLSHCANCNTILRTTRMMLRLVGG